METMFDRIKRMSKDEMCGLIYCVYVRGNMDGPDHWCDSPWCSYFSDGFLDLKSSDLMPNDDVDDLIDTWGLE